MNNRIIFGLVLSIGLLMAQPVFAQSAKKQYPNIEARVQKLGKELNLSPGQAQKITQLMQQQAAKVKQIREEGQPVKGELKNERKAYNSELKTILTGEQWAKLRQIRKLEANARLTKEVKNRVEKLSGPLSLSFKQQQLLSDAMKNHLQVVSLYREHLGGQRGALKVKLAQERTRYNALLKTFLTEGQISEMKAQAHNYQHGGHFNSR